MIGIFLCIGLIGLAWAIDAACSTFEAGPGSWAGFRENWKVLNQLEMRMTTIQTVVGSFRMIPPSRYRDPVEKSQPEQAGIQNEANS